MKSNLSLVVGNIKVHKEMNGLLPHELSNISSLLSRISSVQSGQFPSYSIDWLEFGARLLLFLLTMINTVFDMKDIWNQMSQVSRFMGFIISQLKFRHL